jgi:signal transduction histidine kinase/CheY-like chemotaxis protein
MNKPSSILAASRQRTLARLRLVFAVAVVLPIVGLVGVGAYLYRQAFEEAKQELGARSHIAQEHALKMLETNEMLLARMLDLLGTQNDSEVLARGAEVHERLKRMASELPQVQGLFLHAADSRSLGTSVVFPAPRHIDYADREWYVAQSSGKGRGLFITEQLKSRATGEAFFDMSRRRAFADGSFAGTVNVSLRPEYLTAFYKELAATAPRLRVAVFRSDGRLLARWPGNIPADAAVPRDHPLMRQIAAGVGAGIVESVSPFDPERRVTSFRRLGDYPLYVAAAFLRKDVVAGWASRMTLLSLFVVPMACALAWMAWLGLKRTREELDAVQRLEEETTRRQRSELALAHAQKLEAMGRLTGGVAHDFNNLLMIVGTNMHLLKRLVPQTAASAQVAAIDRALDSGTRLTRQLLAFSRRQALKPERIVLQDRMSALLTLLRPVLPGSIEVTGTVAPDTGAIVVDAAELELALVNLALNARDAMENGGRLEISARNAGPGELDRGGDFVVIDVTDTGTGIDAAIVERVLEPFFTTKPTGRGSGLGLSQVHALCQSAGGTVRIGSRQGGGTRVSLYFERSLAQVDAAPVNGAAERYEALRGSVLLVEDNPDVAKAVQELIESLGCKVERVDNARAALRAVGAGSFDAVVSDIEMPGEIDGIELASVLARRERPLPVVLITGYASRLDQAKSLKLEVLPKPCSPAMLREALARALAGARSLS